MNAKYRHPVAAVIETYCNDNNVSKRALSLRIGCNETWAKCLVSGHTRHPDPADLEKLAALVGVPVTTLIPANGNASPTRVGPFMSDVLVAIDAADWKPERKKDLRQDVEHFCNTWLKRPPSQVPADARRLRQFLQDKNGASFGVSKHRYSNVKSSLNAALGLQVIGSEMTKPIRAIAPAWQDLCRAMPREPMIHKTTGRQKVDRKGRPLTRPNWLLPALSPFIRYCSSQGILPHDVTGAVVEAFAAYRDERDLSAGIATKVSRTRTAWNRAAATVPGWPQIMLSVGKVRQCLNLPLTAFAESFQADLERYVANAGMRTLAMVPAESSRMDRLRARRAAGTDRRGRPLKPLGDQTARQHLQTLQFVASTLVRIGELSVEEITGIDVLVNGDRMGLVVDDIEDRIGLETQYAGTIVKDVMSAGRRWLPQLSDSVLTDLSDLRADAEGGANRDVMSDRDRALLAPFGDPVMMARLASLPYRVFDELEATRKRTRQVTTDMALEAEAAIACLVELTLPVRRRTLGETHLDENVNWPVGGGSLGLLHYRPGQVKSNKPLQAELTARKLKLLELHLQHYRPVLCTDPGNRYMFPGEKPGRHKSLGRLAAQLSDLVFDRLGVRVHTHLWRKILGSYLLATTGDVAMVECLLGHERGSKVTAVYAELQTKWAAAKLDALLEEQLQQVRRNSRPPRRPGTR